MEKKKPSGCKLNCEIRRKKSKHRKGILKATTPKTAVEVDSSVRECGQLQHFTASVYTSLLQRNKTSMVQKKNPHKKQKQKPNQVWFPLSAPSSGHIYLPRMKGGK